MTSFNPHEHADLHPFEVELIYKITTFARGYFETPQFDASHDFEHVMRVTNTAMHILDHEQDRRRRRRPSQDLPLLDTATVILGALLHDVGDYKYPTSQPDGINDAFSAIKHFGGSTSLANKVSELVLAVSYSTEIHNPERVSDIVKKIPELGPVQDADRLDAIGAIGVGRCFTFGGAQGRKGLGNSIVHFKTKLLKLEGMMKTDLGRELAKVRSDRIREFMTWWADEDGAQMFDT